jgi:hypothetical protein
VIGWLRDGALYVELDASTLKEAERAEQREREAQSYVVSRARVSHDEFWRRVDAAREQTWTPTLRRVK